MKPNRIVRKIELGDLAQAGAVRPGHSALYAMYSSQWDGITTDLRAMLVPVDDHLVHRGDGVFETVKCRDGALYAMALHLERLAASAESIHLKPPCPAEEMMELVAETVRAGGHRDALVRILVSRGGGGMGVSPRECPRPQLYIVVYRAGVPFMTAHPGGAKAATVSVPLKPGDMATRKTCNYLPNVLMKYEAERAGADFPLALDERGCLAEGATENFGIVDGNGRLAVPRPGRMLQGITMRRALELAKSLHASGLLTGIAERDIFADELRAVRELLVFGTTPDVTAVVSLDGLSIGHGVPGPVQQALHKLLDDDQRTHPLMRTMVWA